MLDDAKTGIINLIIVKDLSRFGRNYIEVGRYIDYIFPMHNIRFIALNDNVDTASKDSTAMDMMPIINLFNEWHASSTSKKIKAVIEAGAKAGKYRCTHAPYGYDKGPAPNHLPVVDPYSASIVKRIFEMRAKGITPHQICITLNDENVPIPSDYYYQKIGKPNPIRTKHLWSPSPLRRLLQNPTYLGNLVQMRTRTVSYKNHKVIKNDPEDMVIIKNTHEPIISQELWDKVREIESSVSQGKKQKSGITPILSGLMFCVDCGSKMRIKWNNTRHQRSGPRIYYRHNYNCQSYAIFGRKVCASHYIKKEDIEELVLLDIRSMAQLVIDDEAGARSAFLKKKEQQTTQQTAADNKRLSESKYRLNELSMLMQSIYEDKVLGKIPENVCVNLLERYETEQSELSNIVAELEIKLSQMTKNEKDVDEFIARLKKYFDVETLTREMCLELIEYITVDAYQDYKPREIQIYYKFISEPLKNKNSLYDV